MTILNMLMQLCKCDDNFAWYLVFEMDLNGSWLMFQSLGFQQKGNGSQKGWNEIHQTNLEARQKNLEFGFDDADDDYENRTDKVSQTEKLFSFFMNN